MHSDSIMPPELVKARPGKTYAVRSAEIRQLPVDYGIFNGFSTMPNLTTNDGLALDVISNGDKISLCDRNGNLWFGTGSGGVSRYDGKCFKNFTTEQGLANNIVWSIINLIMLRRIHVLCIYMGRLSYVYYCQGMDAIALTWYLHAELFVSEDYSQLGCLMGSY